MEDSRIIELYLKRNELAISATSEKYGGYCSAVARGILESDEDVKECVNDTYLRAWNAIPPHIPRLLAAFLGKITRNLAFNRYRSNTADRRGSGEIPIVLDELSECVGDNSAEQAFERRELVRAIDGFLDALPIKKRSIFVCRYWYNDSIADIARRFGMSEASAAMALYRLRARLAQYLEGKGF